MSATSLYVSKANTTHLSGSTHYENVGIGSISNGGGDVNDTQNTPFEAGFYSNLYLRLTSNSQTIAGTITMSQGGVDKNQSHSIPTSPTVGEIEDVTHTDAVVPNGTYINQHQVNGGGGSYIWSQLGMVWHPLVGTSAIHGTFNMTSSGTASTESFSRFSGINSGASELVSMQFRMQNAGVVRNLNCGIISSSRPTTSQYLVRYNGTDSALAVSVPSMGLGQFTAGLGVDGHSQAFASGDLLNRASMSGTGAGGATAGLCVMTISTFDHSMMTTAQAGVDVSYTASTTVYEPENGLLSGLLTTQSDAQVKAAVARTMSLYECYVVTNGPTTPSTIAFQVGGSDANQAISITNGAGAGWFNDPTHSDAVLSNSQINIRVTPGATNPLVVAMVGARADILLGRSSLTLQGVQ